MVGPLENNGGNIILDGIQFLNKYFSLVFTTENICSYPVPLKTFKEKTYYLGQLFVSPEIVSKKSNQMKNNK